jgi:hypothetical protein
MAIAIFCAASVARRGIQEQKQAVKKRCTKQNDKKILHCGANISHPSSPTFYPGFGWLIRN